MKPSWKHNQPEVISPITDQPLDELLDEHTRQKEFATERKPYWLFVDAARGTSLSYSLFNYFPEAHYRRAIDTALHGDRDDVEPDGGSDRAYFWYDTETNAVLQEEVAPSQLEGLFHWKPDAIAFLTGYARHHSLDDVSHLDLYEATLDRQESADTFVDPEAIETRDQPTTVQQDFYDYLYDQSQLDEFP
jgi:hypothetical protein